MLIQGWGGYPRIDADMVAPATRSATVESLSKLSGKTVIARGMGRSYGDSALAPCVLGTEYQNLLLDFDGVSGTIRCGAGTVMADLLEILVPKGWFMPVTPGTKFISIGGAIASDVHGKNHHVDGCFSDHVVSLDLMLASGEVVTCSKSENADLYHATCGGMGLTGIILEATFRLKAIQSPFVEQTTLKAATLQDALSLFDTHHRATYSVAWIDCLATGSGLGRSLIMLGEHADCARPAPPPKKFSVSIPFQMPAQLLNRFTVKTFNALYYHRLQTGERHKLVHFEPYFYPLDGIGNWNRLYGKPGFIQYQFVLPRSAGSDGMSTVLKRISSSRRGSFLAVLKVFGSQNANLLSFPMAGYTLAVDFKMDDGLFEFLNELDAIVLDFGGRIYLAKDARMSEKTFKQSYPGWEALQEVRARYGAQRKFASLQSRRLGLD
ncbi:FAD-binding oxidoreductase [soil metagenome]